MAASDPLPPLAEEFLEHLQGIMRQHSVGEISTQETVELLELTLVDLHMRQHLLPPLGTALERMNEHRIYSRFGMVTRMLIKHIKDLES